MATNLLVTGATGLVGQNFAKRAIAEGYRVLAMVRPHSDRTVLNGVPVDFVDGDLERPETLRGALSEADVVVHTAALVGDWGPVDKYRALNVVGLDRMLQEAERIGRLRRWIQISSLGVYSYGHHHGTDESTPPQALHFYGYTQSKVEAEGVVLRHVHEHELPAVILRPGFIYGPGDRIVLPRLIENILAGRMRLIVCGNRLLNNTSVENLCDAIVLAIETPDIAGEVFNIRDERLVTREEFVDAIADYIGKPHPGHVPEWIARLVVRLMEMCARISDKQSAPLLTRARMKFLTQNLDFSIEKAKRIFGYRPRVDFRDGIISALDALAGKQSLQRDHSSQHTLATA